MPSEPAIFENGEQLFLADLALIDRVIASVCRRVGLRGADAEDFASIARLALMENDYAILASYEGRAPLGAFLSVVVQRLLTREQVHLWGRWHPSSEAEQLGAAAMLLEMLLVRDRRPLEEAIPLVCDVDPSLNPRSVRKLAECLPLRGTRPRIVSLSDDDSDRFTASEGADARAREGDARRLAARAASIIRDTIATLPPQDQTILRHHFGEQLSIADVARELGIPQRPLYRRTEALLRQLRNALEADDLDAAVIEDLISIGASDAGDFGLRDDEHD